MSQYHVYGQVWAPNTPLPTPVAEASPQIPPNRDRPMESEQAGWNMTCDHPTQTPLSSYRNGCRCDRCRDARRRGHRASVERAGQPYVRCPSCSGNKTPRAEYCVRCTYSRTPVDRVLDRVVVRGGCWEFTGERNAKGYGRIRVGRSNKSVHRVIYEHFVGAIQEGLQIDHLCYNRCCCNPDHLEAVTQKVNLQRARARAASLKDAA